MTKIAVISLCFPLQRTKITKLRMYVVSTELPGEERAPTARQHPVIPLWASKINGQRLNHREFLIIFFITNLIFFPIFFDIKQDSLMK